MADPLNPADYHKISQDLRRATARGANEIPEEERELRQEIQDLKAQLRNTPDTEENQRVRINLTETIQTLERQVDEIRQARGNNPVFKSD